MILKTGNDPYDYEQKYPEDVIYEETVPTARVWKTYEDESRSYDPNMVEESRQNVDVLLVFAGLFSAVVTTFVVQTSQSLQPDYTAMSASLLYESVLVQRAIANGSSADVIAPSSLNPTITFVPAAADVWVNMLWFTSLFLSLATALFAVLAKQWLHHYVVLPSGTPRDRAFTRQFRYGGFKKWYVQAIIGSLPFLMHLALAIFFAGLVIFLRPLHAALSKIIFMATVVVYGAYAVATILPILFPRCPYRTPFYDPVYYFFHKLIPQGLQFVAPESESVQQMSVNLAAEALAWLFSASSNPSVQSIVLQSVGGLPMSANEAFFALQSKDSITPICTSLLSDCMQSDEEHPC
ncbi:hypothetical protein ARMGADRAFT_1125397 [Armillaria gallica]|uniref:DUF6535 domain-containing protein n=1 Tax=Armillaria gallica TaxID=47427 RepID=A0A2H3E8L2_ARMGA|nr:hypothetical protein ARMGADRAFT_1125397 [Armillaria gallica]